MDIEKQKKYFEKHVATLQDCGNIKILDFKKPDSGDYRIRFIFEEDYCRLHISGDLGHLTAVNYNNMTYEKFADFVHNPSYFEEKICCHSRPLYYWDDKKAIKEEQNLIKENEGMEEAIFREYDFWDDQKQNMIDFLSDVFDDFDDAHGIGPVGLKKLIETDYVSSEDEVAIRNFGKTSTGILDLYLLAFELATEQLKQKNGRRKK